MDLFLVYPLLLFTLKFEIKFLRFLLVGFFVLKFTPLPPGLGAFCSPSCSCGKHYGNSSCILECSPDNEGVIPWKMSSACIASTQCSVHC